MSESPFQMMMRERNDLRAKLVSMQADNDDLATRLQKALDEVAELKRSLDSQEEAHYYDMKESAELAELHRSDNA